MSEEDLFALYPTLGNLGPLFDPGSVAVVGASDDPQKFGGRPVSYMLQHGFAGEIFPVNPRSDIIQGIQAYRKVSDIGRPIDMAIISVPGPAVRQAVEECIGCGVKSLIIFSSGYAEIGAAGRQQQEELASLARQAGVRLLGPNCLGLFSVASRLGATFSTSLGAGWPKPGGVSIVGQSGAFGTHVYMMARNYGLGLNYWCAPGNESDVDVADCIAFCSSDPATEAILVYLEGCPDGGRLRAALELARRRHKPVIVMKVGASDVGAEAAQSHTAALAGADRVFEAVFRQHGAMRVGSIDEMLNAAYACTGGRYPTGRRLGAITISGGAGILMADRAADVGLEMPEMPAAAQAELKALIDFSSPRNPIDVTAQALNDWPAMVKNVQVALEKGGFDALVIFMAMVGYSQPIMDRFYDLLADTKADYPEELVLTSMLANPENLQKVQDLGYLVFDEPGRAVDAVAALAWFGENFARPAIPLTAPGAPMDAPAQATEYDALSALAAVGIPTVPFCLATSAAGAADGWRQFAKPVAMKICSADIAHKSDIGGVKLAVDGADAARRAYQEILSAARQSVPDANIAGVLVQPMAEAGAEIIIGMQRDPVFGPVIMAGLGGILVEVLQDVVFRAAPFDEAEAARMLSELQGRALLDGVRGAAARDVAALCTVLSKLSVVAAASPDNLMSVDINPFILGAVGDGGVAVDGLIVTRTT